MSISTHQAVKTLVGRFAARLRFPQLFAFTVALFLLDLLIPDLIPFTDEILLGLAALLLGPGASLPLRRWRRRSRR